MEENFKVPFTKIVTILEHPNANKLEIAMVYGFHCVVSKGLYKAGDEVFYVPIDSIIPQKLEDFWFPPGSKIDRSSAKRRIKQIRIRSVPSQGMILSYDDYCEVYGNVLKVLNLEQDYSKDLEIEKFEPPVQFVGNKNNGEGKPRSKKLEHPLFHQYNGLLNVKWFPSKFRPDELIQAQEKLHGTNARATIQPYNANTWWKKIKRFFGFTPKVEFCYGSNNVQLQEKEDRGGNAYYSTNVYKKAFEQIEAKRKLEVGETIYGEIIGWSNETPIQKNYTYSIPKGELRFILFDVKITLPNGTMRWLKPNEVHAFSIQRGFEMVPVIYQGPFISMEFQKQNTLGCSVYDPKTKVREGIVIKSLDNYDEAGNKRALKFISESYLDKDQTDFH